MPVRNYALSSVSAAEPSLFEIMLYADGNTYRYGFEVNLKEVCREWLYIKSDKKRSKEIELFYRDGKRLIIDEFGSKLHTLLITRVISLFNTKAGNPNKAQLMVTLHDTNILNNSLLRRDQIWFTQKNGRGESELYSLSDYKVRSDASYEKDYLLGKYGATPIIEDLSKALRYESKL